MTPTKQDSGQFEPVARHQMDTEEDTSVVFIPHGVRLASAWAWRIGIVLGVAGALIWLLSQISFLITPILVAALLASLLRPIVVLLMRRGVPAWLAVSATVLGLVAGLLGVLAVVGRQMVAGLVELWSRAAAGLQQIKSWLADGPLQIAPTEFIDYFNMATLTLEENTSSILTGVLSFGSGAGQFVAGAILALFLLIFFLYEGERIFSFLINLLPRRARAAAHGAGRAGWASMATYARIQILVAVIDAVGIGVGAALIGVPLALPLAVLVFIGSFVPIMGALISGAFAVLLALAANGPVNALIMLTIVILVQQVESHILQPLVMGKAMALHPVAVILSVAAGSYLAGIAGALFSVPALAVTNAAVRHVAAGTWKPEAKAVATISNNCADGARANTTHNAG